MVATSLWFLGGVLVCLLGRAAKLGDQCELELVRRASEPARNLTRAEPAPDATRGEGSFARELVDARRALRGQQRRSPRAERTAVRQAA